MLPPQLGDGHAAARVHHASRRRGDRLADCGASATIAARPVIGFLQPRRHHGGAIEFIAAFRQGLRQSGYLEGQNVITRISVGQRTRYDTSTGFGCRFGTPIRGRHGCGLFSRRRSQQSHATDTIPTVFVIGSDPVEVGLVTSLNRPTRQCHGDHDSERPHLGAKRLELLHELAPSG